MKRSKTRWALLAAALVPAACAGSSDGNMFESGGSAGSGSGGNSESGGDSANPGTTGDGYDTGAGSTSGDPGGGTTGGSGPDDPTSATESTGGNHGGSTTSGGSEGASDTEAIRFDVGMGTDGAGSAGDGGQTDGCRGVDFLFVVDNSGSMADEQTNLINSFPGFLQTMQGTLASQARDFHILVTATDAGQSGCYQYCADAGFPSGVWCDGINCASFPPPSGSCDEELGAGRTEDATGISCGVAGGNRFLTSGQPDLEGTFACLARVGTGGSGAERPMDALTNAVTSPLAAAGGCNAGFLRDDAILVVTFITDEEDDASADPAGGSMGDPSDWYDALVTAKGGDASAIVMLGLHGDTDQPAALCDPLDGLGEGAEASPRLRSFVELFGPRGLSGSVCEPDYAPFFDQAVGLIDLACDDFVPPG